MSESNSEKTLDVQRGTVKWFNDAKGFGFIEHNSGEDVFVHYSVIESEGFKTLKDGEEVEYEMKKGPKGLQASRVQRVNPAPSAEATPTVNADESAEHAENGQSSSMASASSEEVIN